MSLKSCQIKFTCSWSIWPLTFAMRNHGIQLKNNFTFFEDCKRRVFNAHYQYHAVYRRIRFPFMALQRKKNSWYRIQQSFLILFLLGGAALVSVERLCRSKLQIWTVEHFGVMECNVSVCFLQPSQFLFFPSVVDGRSNPYIKCGIF